MPSLKQHLIARSRDRDFLLRSGLVIGLLGILSGLLVNHLRDDGLSDRDRKHRERMEKYWPDWEKQFPGIHGTGELMEEMTRRIEAGEDVNLSLEDLAQLTRFGIIPGHLLIPKEREDLMPPDTRTMFIAYGDALHGSAEDYPAALGVLRTAAGREPPPRFANEFLGHVLSLSDEYEEALRLYQLEVGAHPDSEFARAGIVDMLLKLDRPDELSEILDDPAFAKALSAERREQVAIATNQWGEVVAIHFRRVVSNATPAWMFVALLTGAIWFLIVTILGRLERFRSARFAIYLLAFIGGLVSVFVTLGVVIWQEEVLGFARNGDFANDLIYCISGIGLREELIKLLFLAPLLPLLLKRRSSMEALAAAACVGIGFATAENLTYFVRNQMEVEVFGRFLTASFFHASLTGIAGLALFHFVRWPKSRWEELIGSFIAVVVAHGMYNAFAGLVPQLAEQYSIFSIVIFAVTANFYLARAREHREGGPAAISPLGVFVIGASLLVAISWNLACWHLPLGEVMESVGKGALSMGAIAFLFVNQFRGE